MTAIWPTTLPQRVLAEGLEKGPASNNVIRTEMETGYAKTRRRSTAAAREFKAKIFCTLDQVKILNAFYEGTLASGALPFEWINHDQPDTSGLTGFGSALAFEGSGAAQYVYVGDHANLSFTSNIFTFEWWMKTRDLNAPLAVIGKTAANQFEYAIFKPAGVDYLTLYAYDNINGSDRIYEAFITIPDNGWHHYAWAADGANHKAYRDGAQVGGTGVKLTGGDMNSGTAPLTIGRAYDYFGNTYYMDGLLDDVRLWSAARSAGEIAANRSAELVGNEANLVAYWKFNERAGIAANDGTSNNHDGVIYEAKFYPETLTYRFKSAPRNMPRSGSLINEVALELEILP